ncbi:hypothetical protein B9G54_06830 [Alloscardovia macacae]|uniref:Uncharacterized protein n=1 Tax=Alloscardovia macacae TaxID=1160091 RepID=A0A1Y2SX04_9BIFI|nr:hypothetical protein [Alloscardovia macacae]OTA25765.1 hypothetical protein B9G54_06830 [Alloscardovia macacae]OTA28513.1 hypothetical protein B9T39_06445 [Alloscardovia macacae]
MQHMGRYQRAENVGIFTSLGTVLAVAYATYAYTTSAPAIWLVTARRIIITSSFLAGSAAVVFILGYTRSGFGAEKKTVGRLVRRTAETIALAVVYFVSIGLISGAIQMFIAQIFGRSFTQYQIAVVMCLGGVIGYIVYVQAALINSRTIATLLPVFVISGVTLAGMMSDDPNWWKNNFSQLGDRTTFGANVFNFTVVLAGVTMLIISYFALSELTTQERLFDSDGNGVDDSEEGGATEHDPVPSRTPSRALSRAFQIRRAILALLLASASVMFACIGIFRYTPHPFLHNLFARGIAGPMILLMLGMPWLVRRLSVAFYFVSDFILGVIAISYIYWFQGNTSLTNVEALAVILFMGWFILFSRHIAALEADRFVALSELPHDVVQKVGHSRLDQDR